MAEIKARPILFSGPMVLALLEGRKTQTRRIVKPQPYQNNSPNGRGMMEWLFKNEVVWFDGSDTHALDVLCPYGRPGDLLYVREQHYRYGHWEPVPGVKTKAGRMKWAFVQDSDEHLFELPPGTPFRKGRHHKDPSTKAWHRRIARFMPRRMSRLTLRITDVKVERLQDISAADAACEGIYDAGMDGYERWDCCVEECDCGHIKPTTAFRHLWDSINADRASWDSNPWVWAVSFEVIKQNVDDVLREIAA